MNGTSARARTSRIALWLASSAVAALCVTGVAAAQDAPVVTAPLRVGADADQEGYRAEAARSTKTETPLIDTPQSVSVVTRDQIDDQASQNLADVVRYVPGVSFAQGEGNRDTPIFRGNASTADMFVDGVRDDLQYYRDLYNVERVEVLRGPNGLLFGRGGSGGVINRVTRRADGESAREISVQAYSEGGGRLTGDFGQALSDVASIRVTALYEDSESYRDDVTYERTGINPTFALQLGANSTLRLGYEYYDYEFVADRGITTFQGRPVNVDPAVFMGDPSRSPTNATVNALSASFEHTFAGGARLVNTFRYADMDKFYQNVFPGAVGAVGGVPTTVSISAYNNDTDRESIFNQTDLTFDFQTGGLTHNILAGLEIGRQTTDNFRETGYFTDVSPTTTSVNVPLSDPRYRGAILFQQAASDADNHSTADQIAVYLQDQIELSPQWQLVLGARYDRFEAETINNRNGAKVSAEDDLFSPRVGLIFKPMENFSIYASYTQSFVPRAGEQLASLNVSNAALDPEEWENIEVGAKWDINSALSASAAIYQLDRTNVAVTDPLAGLPGGPPAGALILVEGQRVSGVELTLAGQVTDAWSVIGAYAYQDSEILADQSGTVLAGARLAQTPEHSFSLWNRYDFTPNWGVGLGVIHVGDRFAAVENTAAPASNVTLESFTRVDGAVYWTINDNLRFQANIENLLDEDYYLNAHSNTNVTPGSPRAFRIGLRANF